MIGSKETAPNGSPSFVQRVTRKAMSPTRVASFSEKTNTARKNPETPTRIAMIIFFNWLCSFIRRWSTYYNQQIKNIFIIILEFSGWRIMLSSCLSHYLQLCCNNPDISIFFLIYSMIRLKTVSHYRVRCKIYPAS